MSIVPFFLHAPRDVLMRIVDKMDNATLSAVSQTSKGHRDMFSAHLECRKMIRVIDNGVCHSCDSYVCHSRGLIGCARFYMTRLSARKKPYRYLGEEMHISRDKSIWCLHMTRDGNKSCTTFSQGTRFIEVVQEAARYIQKRGWKGFRMRKATAYGNRNCALLENVERYIYAFIEGGMYHAPHRSGDVEDRVPL